MTGVSATAMHDMLNVLAVIEENAGLMHDLLRLAAKEKKLDPHTKTRFESIAAAIQEQVARGGALAEAVKRYGALLECEEESAPCLPMLRQLLQLARRRARSKRLVLEMDECKAPERAGVSASELAFMCLESMEVCLVVAPRGANVLLRPSLAGGALVLEWSWNTDAGDALPLDAVDAAFKERLPGFRVTCEDVPRSDGRRRVCRVELLRQGCPCNCTL
ncbi:hypothetical protein [Megalodesulfovibrio paquesii]